MATCFSQRVVNVWNSLPNDVDFGTLLVLSVPSRRLILPSFFDVFVKRVYTTGELM